MVSPSMEPGSLRGFGSAPGFQALAERPHLVLGDVVVELGEEADDVLVAGQLVLLLLETAQVVQDIELLPSFGEIDFAVNQIWIPNLNEGQVLEHKADVGNTRWGCLRKC